MKKMMIVALLIGGAIMAAAIAATKPENPANNNPELLAIHMIAKHEGFRSTPYKCPGGKMTIGYGFTDEALVKKGTITRKEADRELGIRVRAELAFLRKQVSGLTPKQEAALVSFIYNVGQGAFLKSTLLKRVKEGNWKAAQQEMMRWVYANGKVMKGLVARRKSEAKYLG